MGEDTVADYWGSKYFDKSFIRTEWQSHPIAHKRLRRLQGGVPREQWFADKYLKKPAKRAIGVGSGRAETEISMLRRGDVENFDLYDVSEAGLKYAKTTAESLGFGDRVTCHCVDINQIDIPENTYDLVVFAASLHHMTDLEGILWKLNSSLTDEGMIFAANEYIGPDRFGYLQRDIEVARAFHRILPEKFRKHGGADLILPTTHEVEDADPSESPFSSRIAPTIKHIFPRSEIMDLYGSFAFILFWGLNHDALYESEEGAELVQLIMDIDEGLAKLGAMPSYFAHIVARKTAKHEEEKIRQRPLVFEGPIAIPEAEPKNPGLELGSAGVKAASTHDAYGVRTGFVSIAPDAPRKRKTLLQRLGRSLQKRLSG